MSPPPLFVRMQQFEQPEAPAPRQSRLELLVGYVALQDVVRCFCVSFMFMPTGRAVALEDPRMQTQITCGG